MADIILPINSSEGEPSIPKGSLLHDAARKYDTALLRHLLEKGNHNVNIKDDEGKSPLHVLFSDEFFGHLSEPKLQECLQVLLENNCNVNARDGNGETPLSLAVSNKFECGALALVRNGADTSVRTPKFKMAHSLASKIARSMPKVMLEILDSGVTLDYSTNTIAVDSDDTRKESDQTVVRLDWRPLLQYPNPCDIDSKKHMKSGMRNIHLETSFLYSMLDAEPERRNKYLKHPLVCAFLHLRIRKAQRNLFIFQIISALYPILYMVFIWSLYFKQCKFERPDDDDDDDDDLTDATTVNSFSSTVPSQNTKSDKKETEKWNSKCTITSGIFASAVLLSILVVAIGSLELYLMLVKINWKYLTSWRAMILRVSVVVMGFSLWPALFLNNDPSNIQWQYPFAALGIFFSCILFFMQMELIPKVKIYLEMMAAIVVSVIRIILLFVPLFIGFYMGFSLMFFEIGGIMNFIMMTVDIGSNEFEDMLNSARSTRGWFSFMVNVFTVAFILIITIVFINFLLAHAISDIQELRRSAKITSNSHRVQMVYVINLIFHYAFDVVSKDNIQKGNWFYTYLPSGVRNSAFTEKIRNKLTMLLKSKHLASISSPAIPQN